MTIQIPQNLTPEARQIVDSMLATRQRELESINGLTRFQLLGSQSRIVEPPIWELGHVGWFYEHWVLRNLDETEPIWPKAYKLYDSFNIPNAERWDLAFPTKDETIRYITDVMQRTVQRLDNRELSEKETYFYRLAINHEDMHSETMMHIRQTMRYPRPYVSTMQQNKPAVDESFELHDVSIPGGTYLLGGTHDMPFILDNEKWAHPVEVAPFRISATPVTMAQYEAFVNAGGYQAREFWTDEGWAWCTKQKVEYPVYWEKEGDGKWCVRMFDDMAPLQPFLPMMHVNFYEASAYAAWAGRRLPTEAEWELAASGEPTADGIGFSRVKRWFPWGNDAPTIHTANLDLNRSGPIDVRALPEGDSAFGCRQMIGNVWEWTADTFDAYPGFEIDPYETYSAPSFGQQKVLRGGCWVTRSQVIRNTWRNFYTADRNNIFAGFRTVAL
jgi:gamma-glutamyl hercynylcysteine S-oxide synthase